MATARRLRRGGSSGVLIWVGENGDEQTYTYGRLYREVGRFGNALRKLGVGKGDRVVIYMPLVPEGIIAMLACARIGVDGELERRLCGRVFSEVGLISQCEVVIARRVAAGLQAS